MQLLQKGDTLYSELITNLTFYITLYFFERSIFVVDSSIISELQDTITQLRLEISHLKNEKDCVIERFVEVQPPDYITVKNNCKIAIDEVKILKDRCHVLEHILKYGEISPMPKIIEEYKSMSTFYLQQLAKEVEIYRASSEERAELLQFVEYLHSVTNEIEEMLIAKH